MGSIKILRQIVLAIFMLGIFLSPYDIVKAADLTDFTVTLGANKPNVDTSYIVSFKVATTETIKRINIYFTRASDNPYKPAALDLGGAILSSVSGINLANWSFDTAASSNGTLGLASVDGEAKTADDQISITFNAIHTPELGNCTTSSTSIYDDCYLSINTYSDSGNTLIDSGGTSYHIEDTPSLSFSIEGVNAGTWTNGMITSLNSAPNAIDFGKLEINNPVSAAQKLSVATTAPNGYDVEMKLDSYIQGLDPNNKIEPFAAMNAAWNSPQEWSTPSGHTPNSDSGWIGGNTSDTRVPNWSNAASKFGPVSTTSHTVMYSSTRDRSGTTAYVTYAVEVNQYQPPDSYAGAITYNITVKY